MFKNILLGLAFAAPVLFSGWVRVIISIISISLGIAVPFLYLIYGVSIGRLYLGKCTSEHLTIYFSTMFFAICFSIWASKYERKRHVSSSTVSTSGGALVFGLVVGALYALIFY